MVSAAFIEDVNKLRDKCCSGEATGEADLDQVHGHLTSSSYSAVPRYVNQLCASEIVNSTRQTEEGTSAASTTSISTSTVPDDVILQQHLPSSSSSSSSSLSLLPEQISDDTTVPSSGKNKRKSSTKRVTGKTNRTRKGKRN